MPIPLYFKGLANERVELSERMDEVWQIISEAWSRRARINKS